MLENTNQILTATEVNQNCSKAAKSEKNEIALLTDEEKIDIVAKQVLDKYKPAFEELAK